MVLALCMDFSKRSEGCKPLSNAEFHTLLAAIDAHNGKSDESRQLCLFGANTDFPFEMLGEVDRSFLIGDLRLEESLADKIIALRKRSASVAFELDRFEGTMQVITVFDEAYPMCLKNGLHGMSKSKREPPLLFYSGDLSLFNFKYAAFVGARDADELDAEWTKGAVVRIKAKGTPDGIVSGGSKGIDDISERAALAAGMPVIEYSKNMKKRLADEAIVDAVREGRMLLLSEVNPFRSLSRHEATAHFMNRNKYIYASAEYAVVVRSGFGPKSGTWAGADEALKHKFCKVYVRDAPYKGNVDLKNRGGKSVS